MVFHCKRFVQIAVMSLGVAYSFLLLYQNLGSSEQSVDVRWQERGPRSLPTDYEGGGGGGVGDNEVGGGGVTPAAPAAAARSLSFPTQLQDVFISVKTTGSYHKARLPVILKTWFQLAPNQTWFFTDTEDEVFQRRTYGHMINTNCSSSHNRKALCCKMSVEFDTFLDSNKKWLCHFDDDNYVNVPRLVRMLSQYSPQQDWYLGKPSIRAPLEIVTKDLTSRKISFWFATGGAGFCLSRALALKMMPVAGGGKFISVGEKIRLPDDVTMGYIVEHLLQKPLTVIDQFHSHLEPMKFLNRNSLKEQISFSYSSYGKNDVNVITLDGFEQAIDPTRFLSLHCYLYPKTAFCPARR